MRNKQRNFQLLAAVLLSALFLSGCTGTVENMRVVPLDKIVAAPKEGKSMVVFMRPSDFGGAYRSSLFEIKKNNPPSLVGIVTAKEKVAYQLEPGKHLFMVMGKNVDFMLAELKANKTYYALVMPKMGRWIARFSLYPVPINQLYSSQFESKLNNCEWVEKTPASDDWLNSNMAGIQSKYKEHYAKWISKDLSERPQLLLQDGK